MVHYAYSTLKILGPSGVFSVKTNRKGAVYCAEKLFEALATATPTEDNERPEQNPHPPTKQCIIPDNAALTKEVQLGDGLGKTVKVGA